MKNKPIVSAITFLLISMFYVNSASAGPTYVNIKIPKECGKWKYDSSVSHHCAGTGKGKYVKAGTKGAFKCVGGGNGKGNLMIEMANCPTVIWGTHNQDMPSIYGKTTTHRMKLLKGKAERAKRYNGNYYKDNTKVWRICSSTAPGACIMNHHGGAPRFIK